MLIGNILLLFNSGSTKILTANGITSEGLTQRPILMLIDTKSLENKFLNVEYNSFQVCYPKIKWCFEIESPQFIHFRVQRSTGPNFHIWTEIKQTTGSHGYKKRRISSCWSVVVSSHKSLVIHILGPSNCGKTVVLNGSLVFHILGPITRLIIHILGLAKVIVY